jgi:ATP-dependent exoDNAse (exonuclease V) beta subunit
MKQTPTTLSSRHAHIRDANIRFQEEGHKYTILTDLASKYTSCTTWNHSHFAKFDSDAIIESMMKGKNWNPSNKYWGLTANQIKQQWASSGQAAAEAGTQMHYEIECFINGGLSPQLPNKYTHQDLLQEERGFQHQERGVEWDFFLQFVRDTPHLVPYRTEWLIYDDQVKISGSIDMVYENQEDGTLVIYDWKRVKSIDKTNGFNKWATTECISHLPDSNFWHYALQLNTYKTILERNYGRQVSGMYLVRLHPDNPKKTYELVKVPALESEMTDLFNKRVQKLTEF